MSDPQAFGDEQLKALVPDWLDDQMTVTNDWIRSIQHLPSLWVRFRREAVKSADTLAGPLMPESPSPGRGTYEYVGEADLFQTPEFRAGAFEIQDLSSQWVGFLCDPKPGESWWDVCAGEGGKFLDLADRMENRGSIWVTDRSPWRLKRLKHRAARAKVFNYRSRLADLSRGVPFKVKFDGVIVDAPCSGIGTWHRNPDARWTTTPEDIVELASLQKSILKNAAAQVKAGGRLVYAVCTLATKETVEIADWFDAEMPGFVPLNLPDPGLETSSVWPSSDSRRWLGGATGEGNGMFVAAWRRA
ncbi:MAG: RsmB/NOP family class I SAM-dependent RNA methyltransferase [Verrucomicrobia bacterium]|nr:RsmB/NOP family class I SAM-dependent RNA methyltransferase [Verrucomicrobiota bacterium]